MNKSKKYPHAVAELRALRKEKSTRPFLSRGCSVDRCERCRISVVYCICSWQPKALDGVGMCLVMHDKEPLKPSNTGWLIADVIKETFAFGWSRVGEMQGLKALLNDPQWQPYLVFPEEYAEPHRVTRVLQPTLEAKKPLFILLDATWTEARKIFRKSPYFDALPVLSLNPEQLSRYQLRRSKNAEHLCTAEVATLCLELANETEAAGALNTWFELFTAHYMASKKPAKVDTDDALHQQALLWQR